MLWSHQLIVGGRLKMNEGRLRGHFCLGIRCLLNEMGGRHRLCRPVRRWKIDSLVRSIGKKTIMNATQLRDVSKNGLAESMVWARGSSVSSAKYRALQAASLIGQDPLHEVGPEPGFSESPWALLNRFFGYVIPSGSSSFRSLMHLEA